MACLVRHRCGARAGENPAHPRAAPLQHHRARECSGRRRDEAAIDGAVTQSRWNSIRNFLISVVSPATSMKRAWSAISPTSTVTESRRSSWQWVHRRCASLSKTETFLATMLRSSSAVIQAPRSRPRTCRPMRPESSPNSISRKLLRWPNCCSRTRAVSLLSRVRTHSTGNGARTARGQLAGYEAKVRRQIPGRARIRRLARSS